MYIYEKKDPSQNKTHPHSILQVPTTQLAKMRTDPKFVELTADALKIFFYEIHNEYLDSWLQQSYVRYTVATAVGGGAFGGYSSQWVRLTRASDPFVALRSYAFAFRLCDTITLYGCMTWSPKSLTMTDYDGFTAPCSSDALDGGNGSATTTPYRTPTRLPRQIPRALRR